MFLVSLSFFLFLIFIYYRSVIFNERNNMQAWGLIVLLISKAAGHLNVNDMEEDKAVGVLHRYNIITYNKIYTDNCINFYHLKKRSPVPTPIKTHLTSQQVS